MAIMMCLHSEMSPSGSKNCKLETKTDLAASSLDNISSPRLMQRMGCQKSLKKRKPKRVLYPSQVRKYLPRQEKDKAKKWLLILGAIVFFQILLEDGGQCEHEVHKNLVSQDAKAMKVLDSAKTSTDSRTLLSGQGPKNMTLGNSTILYFIHSSQGNLDFILSRSIYYDSRTDYDSA